MKTILKNGTLTVAILHKGAELCSIKMGEQEFIWDADPNVWVKHSPVLFPIVGSLKNDKYTFENNSYYLARHGFARDMDFELIASSEIFASFLLKSSVETLKNYPFEFEFYVNYYLNNKELKTSFMVKNLNSFQMPFAVGGHPAFDLQYAFEDYSIAFENDEVLECYKLNDGLISAEKYNIHLNDRQFNLTYKQFENDAMVMKSLRSRKVTLKYKNTNLLSVKFTDFPNLGIWTKPNAQYICIEPWLGYADIVDATGDILNKEGIQILDAFQTTTKNYTITIL